MRPLPTLLDNQLVWVGLLLWMLPVVISTQHHEHKFRGTARKHLQNDKEIVDIMESTNHYHEVGGNTHEKHYRHHYHPPWRETTLRTSIQRQIMEDKEDEIDDYEDREEEVTFTSAPTSTAEVLSSSPPTVAPMDSVVDEQEEQPTDAEIILLPFSIQVQGIHLLGTTNEIDFRWHLQSYLTQFFQRPMLALSTMVDSIQLDRPWMTTITNNNDNQFLRRRALQDDTTETSTVTANATATTSDVLMQYQGRALLKANAGFFDVQPTMDSIHEAQVVALEDSVALQEFFIGLLFSQDPNAVGPEGSNIIEEPVIFIDVQVSNRPTVEFDPVVTWDRIEEWNETLKIQEDQNQEEQQQQQHEHEDKQQESSQMDVADAAPNTIGEEQASSAANPSGGLSSVIIAVIIVVVLIICFLIGAFVLMLRSKRKRPQKRGKIPGAPNVHGMEVISDVDSDENLDDNIVHDKSLLRQQKASSPTLTRTSSWCEEDDNSKSGRSQVERTVSRVSSLFRKSSKSSTDKDKKEDLNDFAIAAILPSGSHQTVTLNSNNVVENGEGGEIFPHVNPLNSRASPAIDLTTPCRNSTGVQFVPKEAPSAAPRSMLSLFTSSKRRESALKPSQEDHDELDLVMAKMNLYSSPSYDDEESMMGYSLASNQQSPSVSGIHALQQMDISMLTDDGIISTIEPQGKSSSGDTPALTRQLSGEDCDSSHCSELSVRGNSMLPGVQNLLNGSANKRLGSAKKKRNKKWYRSNLSNRPQFISDSESVHSLDHVMEEESAKSESSQSDVFIEDDDESVEVVDATQPHQAAFLSNHEDDEDGASAYKEVESMKETVSSVISNPVQAADMNASGGLSALGYFKFNTNSKNNTSGDLSQSTHVASEEMDEGKILPKTPVIINSGLGLVKSTTNMIPDDVSDAPSDEQGQSNVATLAPHSLMGSAEAIRHVSSSDNNPAVGGYLVKERRTMQQRLRRKRADRKQPPVTMEV